MAGLDLVTAPTVEPITAPDAKARLRIDFADEDGVVQQIIKEARSAVEAFLNQSLLYTTWTYRIDGCFPTEIRLPVGPLRTTDGLSIEYVDDAGGTTTLSASLYQVSIGMTGVIRPAYGQTWPSTRSQMDAVSVTFKAGEADAVDIRPAIVSAIYLEVGNRYAHRESALVGVAGSELSSLSARNLLTPFVRYG